jgi:hypothetical protein
MGLTRAQILAASDLPTEVVAVPEWGGDVTLRVWTGTERDKFETEQAADKNANLRARVAARSIVGDDGKPLFTLADIDALGAKSGSALDRIVTAALKLNKYTTDDVEQLAKNSNASPSVDSSSASPSV